MKLKTYFEDILPIKRKSSADWIVPMLTGMGIGVLAGVSIGMLFAPQTGEQARLRLRHRANRVKERAGELADRARGQLSSTASEIQARTS